MGTRIDAIELQPFIEQTLELWHVPGASVAVVQDGQVVLNQGFGVRNTAAGLPVTADTLFPIASCTKAFTAMGIALLVDEGKLAWDTPVRTYLPDFKLYDPYATASITLRDMLCHRSGLPRHDIAWYASNFNRKEIVRRLPYLEPNQELRATWQYQNMMYTTAGFLIGELTGMSWERFIQQRIFDALGMRRTNTSTSLTQQDADHSRPYSYRDGVLTEFPYYEVDEGSATGPAGAINSCANDMAMWLVAQWGGSGAAGRALVAPHTLAEMHKPHMFIEDPQMRLRFESEFLSYGLGWFLRSYKGQFCVSHGGNIDGFSSLVSFLPCQNIGVVVLSNGDGLQNAIPTIITNTVYDRIVGLAPTDWNARYRAFYDERTTAEEQSRQQSQEQRRAAPLSHPLEDYLGDYEHPGYGIYSVRSLDHGLELVANDKIHMPLEHYHYDVFDAYFERFHMHLKLTFASDCRGMISGFSTQIDPLVKDIVFTRLPDRHLSDPAVLVQCVGTYDVQGTALVVELKEGKLFVSLPGQNYELLPYRGMEFTFKGLSGYSVTFQQYEAAWYQQVVLTQPGWAFTAQRTA